MARGRRVSKMKVGTDEFVVVSVAAPVLPPDLSGVESEIVKLVLEGRSDAQIAAARRIAPRTVANHLRRVFRKLGVRSRAELVVRVCREK